MKLALLVVFVGDALLANLFVVLYPVFAPWRSTSFGRQMMTYGAVVAGMLDLSLVSLLSPVPLWIWFIGYIMLGVALFWRLWLFVVTQWGGARLPERVRQGENAAKVER
jgi:hypothetical protein